MTDVHDRATRSRNMAAIRSVNTRPEIAIRGALHRAGLRYRLHKRGLPGRPDIVLPKYRAAVFIHGCFFHGHGCATFRWPKTRVSFWRDKIEGNRSRDQRNEQRLLEGGWRVAVIWECAARGAASVTPADIAGHIVNWLQSSNQRLELPRRHRE